MARVLGSRVKVLRFRSRCIGLIIREVTGRILAY